MAINQKGSRKIIVYNKEFRWRVTGNDGWISVAIWPVDLDMKIVGTFDYHSSYESIPSNGVSYALIKGQILITSRVIRKIIEFVSLEKIVEFKGTMDLGHLEKVYDIEDAIREPIIIKEK